MNLYNQHQDFLMIIFPLNNKLISPMELCHSKPFLQIKVIVFTYLLSGI